jgi:hypothetical protein
MVMSFFLAFGVTKMLQRMSPFLMWWTVPAPGNDVP